MDAFVRESGRRHGTAFDQAGDKSLARHGSTFFSAAARRKKIPCLSL
jgi:4-hydroxy-L-threonine phosphate dehydrogenase PdxA